MFLFEQNDSRLGMQCIMLRITVSDVMITDWKKLIHAV